MPVWDGILCSSRTLFLCAGSVFLVALGLYVWTLAPTVTLIDSGELIVAARFLGVAHPPGTPLWVMLAHLASLVPWGNVAMRVNFSSALFAALATAILTLGVAELMMSFSWVVPTKPKKGKSETNVIGGKGEESHRSLMVLLPAVGSGLALTFARTLWAYATITEVYALNTLLIVTILFLMLAWRRRIVASRARVEIAAKGAARIWAPVTEYDHFLYAAALVFGLALGVHHVTVALILPAIAVLVLKTEGVGFYASKRLLYAALLSTFALLVVYTYLPLAASRSPMINWGNPRSLQEIWWHVSGRQYQVFFEFVPKSVGIQLVQFGRMALREFGSPWIPAALAMAAVGLVYLFKWDRAAFWFVALLIVADLSYSLVYEIAEDKDAYCLPAFIAIVLAVGFGFRWIIGVVGRGAWPNWRSRLVGSVAVLVIAGTALAGNWPFNNRRQYFIAQDYVDNIFKSTEPNALLLTYDWQVVSPMFYAQQVEHLRPDTKIVDVNLLRRSWYFDYLRRAHPDLIERSRDKVDPFVRELKAWEKNPQLYEIDVSLNRRINTLFLEMVHGFVLNEGEVGPVYVAMDMLSPDRRDDEVVKWLGQNYQPVPEGLVFRLAGDTAFHDPPEIKLATRGLADGTLRFAADDVVTLKVLPVYLNMSISRGRYLAQHDQRDRAAAAFRQALALDPGNALAQQGLQSALSTEQR